MKFYILSILRKYVEKIQVWWKSEKNNGYFTRRPLYTYDSVSLNYSYNEKYFRQNLQRKWCRLWDNVERYSIARGATDDNLIRRILLACWITKATYARWEYVVLNCFSTARMVTPMLLNVMLYLLIYCLSSLICFNSFTSNSARCWSNGLYSWAQTKGQDLFCWNVTPYNDLFVCLSVCRKRRSWSCWCLT